MYEGLQYELPSKFHFLCVNLSAINEMDKTLFLMWKSIIERGHLNIKQGQIISDLPSDCPIRNSVETQTFFQTPFFFSVLIRTCKIKELIYLLFQTTKLFMWLMCRIAGSAVCAAFLILPLDRTWACGGLTSVKLLGDAAHLFTVVRGHSWTTSLVFSSTLITDSLVMPRSRGTSLFLLFIFSCNKKRVLTSARHINR